MQNFLEKLKDIIYDSIDYIMIAVIIAVVALVINWRLDGLFATDTSDVVDEPSSNTIDIEDIVSEDDEDDVDEEKTGENEQDEQNPDVVIKVNIPAGSLPNDIGDILMSHELVDSRTEFINKAIELNLDTRLKSGDFNIPSNSSLEEMLDILTK